MTLEPVSLLPALMAGLVLGSVFFGGLWWTVRRGFASSSPAVWFLGSMLLRTGLTLTGFYLISRGHWGRLVACLCGFIVARFFVMRLTGSGQGGVASHAP